MRNLLALTAFLVLVFAGVGWWLGWYQFSSNPAAQGHRSVTIDVNSKKISADLEKGKEKLRDLLDKNNVVSTGGNSPTPPAPPQLPVPPPPPHGVVVEFDTSDDGSFTLQPKVRIGPPR